LERYFKMKICLINFAYPPYEIGGSTIYTKILAESLKRRGHEVIIITTGKSFFKDSQGIKIYRIYPFGVWIPFLRRNKISLMGRLRTFVLNFWNPDSYFKIKKILEKEKPDVVHIHEIPYLSLSVYSAVKRAHIPIIVTIHSINLIFPMNNLPELDEIAGIRYPLMNSFVYKMISKAYSKINKMIAKPEVVIFPTKAIKDIYEKEGFFKNSKKEVIYNFLEDKKNKKSDEKKKTFDIIFTGGYQLHKGGQTIIRAVKEIKDNNIRIHFFGEGRKKIKDYFKKIAENDKRIIFYGNIKNEKLEEFRKEMDVGIVPSIYFENCSMSILENFRSEIPVVATNIGGNPELIKEGYNGYLFNVGDKRQLKEILNKLMKNKKILKKMGKNAYRDFVKKFNEKKIIEKIEKIYKKLSLHNKKEGK